MFAYCNNNPVMYSDPTGCSLILRFWIPKLFIKAAVDTAIVMGDYFNNSQYDKDENTTTKNTLINDQNSETGNNFDYGLFDAQYNSCGTIATHNAKVLKGLDSTLSETIVDFQLCGAMMAYGALGSNPYSIGAVLSKNRLEYSMVGLNEMTSPGVYIISYWNEGMPWHGIHTVAVTYDGAGYTTYNYDGNGDTCNLSPFTYATKYICGYYLG